MSDLISRLKKGFGSSAGRKVQIEAYQDICYEAQARIKELEDGVRAHKVEVEQNSYINPAPADKALWKKLGEVEV